MNLIEHFVGGKIIPGTSNKKGKVFLNEPAYAVSKGQGCVFYKSDGQLLGGGWIK